MYVGLTDEESFVKVTYEAYPKPFSGHWNVHNTIVPIGETNVEKKLITFEISDGLNENEYVAILNFFMDSTFVANETFNLVIKNEMGSAIIPIDIKPQFKPEINENWSETNKGNSCTIEISMRANPKPTNGNWLIDDIIVPIGESSKNGAFQSEIKLSKMNKSQPWTINHLDKAIKCLKKDKARDPNGWINDIFKEGVVGRI